MIEEIEKLRAEVQPRALSDREALDQRKVGVHEPWSGNRRAISCPKLANRGRNKAIHIKPLRYAFMGANRITNLIRTVHRQEVIFEIDARLIVAVENKYGEPGRRFFNYGDLPIAQSGIQSAVPVPPNPLTAPDRQIVNHASRELLTNFELCQSPIEMSGAGQRPVSGADVGT